LENSSFKGPNRIKQLGVKQQVLLGLKKSNKNVTINNLLDKDKSYAKNFI